MKKWGIVLLIVMLLITALTAGGGVYLYMQKDGLGTENGKLTRAYNELKLQNEELQQSKNNAEVLANTLEDKVSNLEEDVSRLEDEADDLLKEIDDLNEEISSLNQTVSDLENKETEVIYMQPPDPSFEATFEYQKLFPEMYVDTVLEYTSSNEKTVYLTFDDGPSERTEELLKILAEHNIKATFFVVPNRSAKCTERLKAIVDAGHTIGIHTATHEYNKIYASVDSFLKDFNQAWNIVYEATGIKCDIFRFPGGSINSYNRLIYQPLIAEMTRRGFVYYDWNTSGDDSAGQKTAEGILNKTIQTAGSQKKVVLLLHDNSTKTATVEAVPSIIEYFKNKGYAFAALTHDVKPVSYAYRSN